MPRYIDTDKLDDVVQRLNDAGWEITRSDYKRIESVLFEFPTADVVERKDIEAECELAYKHGYSDCFAERRWIPVTERLPETYKSVLTTAKGRGSRVRENFLINAARGEWSYDTYSVLAWMPLPKPYREEASDV